MAKKITFEYLNWRDRAQQSFDKEKITIKKAGKEYNVYDMIQEARVDTEIYPTLEKYGCLDKIICEPSGVYADLREAMDLRSIYDQQKKAEELWYQLPLEVRKDFDHSPKKFAENGLEYFRQKAEAEKKAAEVNNTTTNNGENNE